MNVELPDKVRVEVIATLFGVSVRRIQQLTQEGVICAVKTKGQRGSLYPLRETVQAYIAHLSNKRSGNHNSKQALDEARIVKLELESRALETKVQIQEGEVHTTHDVELVMNDMIGTFKTRLWNFPQAVIQKLEGVTDKQARLDILTREINVLSSLLADYNPEDFYARNPDYLEGGGIDAVGKQA